MEFSPLLHAKKRNKKISKNNIQLLPVVEGESKVKSEFTGICVQVDLKSGIKLHKCGCFGQMVQDTNILMLGLEEAFFLSYFLEVLAIYDKNNEMHWRQFLEAALIVNPNFVNSIASYLYLRSKGWIVKSGIKFGGNFLIYKNGPNFYHACFVVFIESESMKIAAKDIKGYQRVSETANKDVLILNVIKPMEFILTDFIDFYAIEISETIVRRFHFTSFVQKSKNNT